MNTAKIFKNGRSQAVRLPKEYRIDADDVFIKKIGDVIMLIPKDKIWEAFRNSFDGFSSDLDLKREDDIPQERKDL